MRIFTAIPIPAKLRQFIIEKNVPISGTKWIVTENLHITLRFIGKVSEEDFLKIKEAFHKIPFSPFSVKISDIGIFGSKKSPRIIWRGIKPEEKIIEMKKSIDEILYSLRIEKEKRSYRPHITIGRIKQSGGKKKKDFLEKNIPFTQKNFLLIRFVCFQVL
ncbi:MAG: RNA 2',3'-cyclic phosphodiesterase [Verrucomicrobiota bacterium]|nr:RNA 2',3'-cyclic phosphodiesterase [Verrucomicrobiota bacterium]